MQIPRRKADALRKPDDGPVHLTEGGFLRLQKRLAELKAALPHLISEASEAAAQGDRSDNDAYKQSKSLLRRTHRQIWSIEDQMKRVAIIPSGLNASGTVQLGSTVVLEIEGEKKIFEILGSPETNPTRGRISHVSPLGAALIGHKKDDEIEIKTEKGPRAYKIIEIR